MGRQIDGSSKLKDGDLLYYKYPNGITMTMGYDSKFDSKNISLDSLNNTYLLYKVVRNGKVLWEKDSNNNSSGLTN